VREGRFAPGCALFDDGDINFVWGQSDARTRTDADGRGSMAGLLSNAAAFPVSPRWVGPRSLSSRWSVPLLGPRLGAASDKIRPGAATATDRPFVAPNRPEFPAEFGIGGTAWPLPESKSGRRTVAGAGSPLEPGNTDSLGNLCGGSDTTTNLPAVRADFGNFSAAQGVLGPSPWLSAPNEPHLRLFNLDSAASQFR
jgi:hypothetical protein